VSSATAIPAPVAVYREEQLFGWWWYALMAAMVAIACYFFSIRHEADQARSEPATLAIVVGLTLPAIFTLGVLRMTTEVTATRIEVWFGWVPTYRRAFDAGAVRRVEVVTYRPWADCGGWGIRTGPDGERVFNARGNRGVRLQMVDGSRLLLGSQTPESLAEAIERAMNPAG
jgi:hypothetical protein